MDRSNAKLQNLAISKQNRSVFFAQNSPRAGSRTFCSPLAGRNYLPNYTYRSQIPIVWIDYEPIDSRNRAKTSIFLQVFARFMVLLSASSDLIPLLLPNLSHIFPSPFPCRSHTKRVWLEYAKSMPTLCEEYACTMRRLWVEYAAALRHLPFVNHEYQHSQCRNEWRLPCYDSPTTQRWGGRAVTPWQPHVIGRSHLVLVNYKSI